MVSVTKRIQEIKQPRGGYIKPKQFIKTELKDGITLSENITVNPVIVGLAVDYLTRYT